MMPSQKRALADIAACCTKELGGRLYHCDDCQGDVLEFSLLPQSSRVPNVMENRRNSGSRSVKPSSCPVTISTPWRLCPAQLRDAFRRDQKFMYDLFMKVSAAAVKELCAKKRHLGALPGILSVLHTWNGDLGYHVHVHMLITGGGITPDGLHFEPTRGKFLLPVAVLSRKIAAMFREALRKERPGLLATIPESVWQREWVSFCKHYGQRQRGRAELPVAVCLPHGHHQCPNPRPGRYPRDVPLQGPKYGYLEDDSAARRRVFATFPPARPAARISQGSLLRTLALFQASPGEPGLVALDAANTDRCGRSGEDRGSAQSLQPNGPEPAGAFLPGR